MMVAESTLEKHAYSAIWSSDEYTGSCPWCHGTNRFHVWPDANDIPGIGPLGRYHCMGYESGRAGCGRKGDGVQYLQERRSVGFLEACNVLGIDAKALLTYRATQKGEEYRPQQKKRTVVKPHGEKSPEWQESAELVTTWAQRCLLSQYGHEALTYLLQRGLTLETIKDAHLGFCPEYRFQKPTHWGYSEKDKDILLCRGIVIPWFDDSGRIVCLRFRRLQTDESEETRKYYGVDEATGEIGRYHAVRGSSSHNLYGGDCLFPGCDALLLEGELDRLIAVQEIGTLASAVATGSTSWARVEQVTRQLAACDQVLVAYNADDPGDKASEYWLAALKNAQRWRPLWNDANDMMRDGVDLREWVTIGLEHDAEAIPQSFYDRPCRRCGRIGEARRRPGDGLWLCPCYYEAVTS